MPKKMWMVRAGRGAFLFQNFEEKNYVAVGWSQLGNLTGLCRIHDTKPKHCREFLKTKRHALLGGFPGFGEKKKEHDDQLMKNITISLTMYSKPLYPAMAAMYSISTYHFAKAQITIQILKENGSHTHLQELSCGSRKVVSRLQKI